MAGRKPKLNATKLGNRTKEELEEAALKENGLKQFQQINVDNVPEGLTENAAKEWLRVVPLLEQLPIAELDYSLIKKYCEVLDQNDTLYQAITSKDGIEGMVDPDTNRKTGAFMAYMESLKELRSICGSYPFKCRVVPALALTVQVVLPACSNQQPSTPSRYGKLEPTMQ